MAMKNTTVALLLAAIPLLAGVPHSAGQGQKPSEARPDKAALQKLVQKLGGNRFEDREEAGKQLVAAGEPALEMLQEAAKSSDLELSRRAAVCIEDIKKNLKIAKLIAQMQSPSVEERRNGVVGLHNMEAAAASAVPALIRALDDPDLHVRDFSMNALAFMGRSAKPAVPRLIALIENPMLQDRERDTALLVLGRLRDNASDATPSLLKLVKSQSYHVSLVVSILGYIGKNHDAVIPVLLDLLKHEDLQIRVSAAVSLGRIGKQPTVVVPALVELLRKHKDKPKKGSTDPRYPIICGLANFGPQAKSAVPLLVEILTKDEDFDDYFERTGCLEALRAIGPDAKEAVPALLKFMNTNAVGQSLDKEIAKTVATIRGTTK